MTYFPDLSPYHFGELKNTVNTGWLQNGKPYQQGDTPTDFQERLQIYCQTSSIFFKTRGFHECEFCGQEKGNGTIIVFGKSKNYAAPVMVYHYVKVHGYQPPQEFVQAVIEEPLPDSVEYRTLFWEMIYSIYPRFKEAEQFIHDYFTFFERSENDLAGALKQAEASLTDKFTARFYFKGFKKPWLRLDKQSMLDCFNRALTWYAVMKPQMKICEIIIPFPGHDYVTIVFWMDLYLEDKISSRISCYAYLWYENGSWKILRLEGSKY